MPGASYSDMTAAASELEGDAWATAGYRDPEELSKEKNIEAAEEISARMPKVKPPKKERRKLRKSKVFDAINTLEPDAILTTQERIEKEAAKYSKKAAPIRRPSGQMYHPRDFEGSPDVEVVQRFREAKVPLLLSGYPGCGKTSLVEAAFASEEGPITVAGHGEMEMSELIGRYVVRPGNEYEWIDGPLVVAMKTGRVLFVDDVTLIPSGVLARLYPVMDGRGTINVDEHEGEVVNAAPGFVVMGAHNPGVPGAVLSEALASRFALHMDVPTDFGLAIELGIDRKIVKAAQKITALRTEDLVGWAPAMRELLAYQKIKDLVSEDAAIQNLLSQCPEVDREEVKTILTPLCGTVMRPLTLGDRI